MGEPADMLSSIILFMVVYNPTITRREALSPTSIALRWSQLVGSPNSYEITYKYIGPCDGVTDSGRIPVNEVPEPFTGSVERNLTGLQEFSNYSISVIAIYDEGSAASTTSFVTLPAGVLNITL